MAAVTPRSLIGNKDKKVNETPDLAIKRKKYKVDLVPPVLVVERYFDQEQAAIEELQVEQESTTRELEELVNKLSGEEGLLKDATNERVRLPKVVSGNGSRR